MAITVAQLISDPLLKTHAVAGHRGLGRRVSWAHSCELAEPWGWLGRGDLLMTIGISIPRSAAEQEEFVRRLDAEGVCGMAIGQDHEAPPLTDAMFAVADRLEFPLLFTPYEVPFAAVSRVVAQANRSDDQLDIARTVRIYESFRRATVDGDGAVAVIAAVTEELGAAGVYCATDQGHPLLKGTEPLPTELREDLGVALAAQHGGTPAVLRLRDGDSPALALPIPATRPGFVVVVMREGRSEPSLIVLGHVATIVALEVERLAAEREQRRRIGAELLAQIVDARIDAAVATAQLRVHGVDPDDLIVAAIGRSKPSQRKDLHVRLAEREVAHVLLRRGEVLLVVLDGEPDHLAILCEVMGEDAMIGVSDRVAGAARIPDATREAQWALRTARALGRSVAVYGEHSAPFLPRSTGEAQLIVDRVLGPLLAYDRENKGELVASLSAFLDENRSWLRAAKRLFVHKQTLVYRMKRVEALTGRRLDETGNVAELWLALQALELTERS